MQNPTTPTPASYVVRLSGALAALLGRAESAELPEDDLRGSLKKAGLITYPSPLLEGLLAGELPDVFAAKVLPQLDPTDLAMFGRVGKASRAAVVSSGLPRAGASGGVLLRLNEFLGSVQRLTWAGANDCPCVARVCALAAAGGHLDVLKWARGHGCSWEEDLVGECCALAAQGGHLEVLKWLREQDCQWDVMTCAQAAAGGHLDLLKWVRDYGCPWEETTEGGDLDCCAVAARGGHLEVLTWLWENDCPWDGGWTCASAAAGGHLEVLKWARAHGFTWDARTRRRPVRPGTTT